MGFKYYGRPVQRSKHGNTISHCKEGHKHRSKLESSVCAILHMRLRTGEFTEIKCEDHLYLTDAKIGYVVDFRCTNKNGTITWVEAKGFPNDTWPIKKKLWKFYGPGILEVWRGTHKSPILEELVVNTNPEFLKKKK